MFKFSKKLFSNISHKTFLASETIFNYKQQVIKPDFNDIHLMFGRIPTDYMVTVQYEVERGWSAPVIEPFGYLQINPFNSTLHYAFSCFEGLKAYRDPENNIRLFRHDMNTTRLIASCKRVTLPSFDRDEFTKLLEIFVKLENNWISSKEGSSLYIRPFVYSNANYLGVEKPNKSILSIVASPVGSYFSKGKIKLLLDETYWRGTPKGASNFKISANYAPSVFISGKAHQKGYSQVIWSYNGNLLESGASNLFFVLKSEHTHEIVTHPLDGSILPGVTRDTILQTYKTVFPKANLVERAFNINEFIAKKESGDLKEVFMSGTAAVISQVDVVTMREVDYEFGESSEERDFSTKMKKYILAIQRGLIEHKFSKIIK